VCATFSDANVSWSIHYALSQERFYQSSYIKFMNEPG